jgi:transcriptional regulator with XRE-family HTH domain
MLPREDTSRSIEPAVERNESVGFPGALGVTFPAAATSLTTRSGSFGAFVRLARRERRLDQRALAELLNTHVGHLRDVESGKIKSPGLLMVCRLGIALDIAVPQLVHASLSDGVQPRPVVSPPNGVSTINLGAWSGQPAAMGHVIRVLRGWCSMTQRELAHRAGAGERNITKLETGKTGNPRLMTVARLADALVESRSADTTVRLVQVFAGEIDVRDALQVELMRLRTTKR